MKNKFYNFFALLSLLPMATAFAGHCSKSSSSNRSEWDYIIVGDGTAGATLATKLTDCPKVSALVLEWGENRTDDPAVLSPSVFAYSDLLTYNPKYALNPIVPVKFPNKQEQYFIYSDGRMWGGSSAHNGLFAVRGTADLYNSWAAISGSNKWSYNKLRPLMIGMERYTADGTIPDPLQRGLSGPLAITQSAPVNTDPFAIAVGIATNAPQISDYNNPSLGNIGISAHQQFITPPGPNSERTFSANAYQQTGVTVDANGNGLNGRRLKVQSNALVNRVLFHGSKAIGVEVWINGDPSQVQQIYANKEIILSAGSIRTAAILERSGIGDPAVLGPLGIDVLVANPNVGANVYNQYGAGGIFAGISTSATPFFHGYTNNSPYMPNDDVRRIQLIGININIGVPAISLNGIVAIPKSKGTTHIVSTNPTVESVIDLNMYSDGPVTQVGSDAFNVVSYLKLLPGIATATGSTLIAPTAAEYLAGDNALLSYAEDLSHLLITYHMVGSCRMSSSMIDGVVDSKLRVFGVKNLRCVDNSIQPLSVDGNTAYAAYIIGLRAADFLLPKKCK